MNQLNVLDAVRGERGGYKVDVNRGERIGRVSAEWFSRPADRRSGNVAEGPALPMICAALLLRASLCRIAPCRRSPRLPATR